MRWLSHLTLARRLTLGFGLVLLMLVGITAAALATMAQMAARTTAIVEVNNKRVALAGEMTRAVDNASIAVRNLVLIPWVDELPSEAVRMKKALKKYSESKAAFIALVAQEDAGSAVRQQLVALATAERDARPVMLQVAELAVAEKKEDATTLVALDMRQAQASWVGEIDKLSALEAKRSDDARAASERSYQLARVGLLVAALLALALGSGAALLISRSVTRPVSQAVAAAQRVADGDLSRAIDVKTRDETGQLLAALVHMQSSLRALVGEVQGTTDHLASASREIASGNQDLSIRTERAAANLQRTASAMQQLSGAVTQSAQSARHANELAASASKVALRGGDAMTSVMSTMQDISQSSRRIADIVSVIDGLAFQTNLLALNAAVEAARAGDGGRGFAVVAGEVRGLAQRSAQAAKEIRALIERSVGEVDAGYRLANEAGATMRDIVGSVNNVLETVARISTQAQDQSHGLEQVSLAVSELDRMTQQNAALVEQSAAAAAALKDQADRLGHRVAVFKLEQASAGEPPPCETLAEPAGS